MHICSYFLLIVIRIQSHPSLKVGPESGPKWTNPSNTGTYVVKHLIICCCHQLSEGRLCQFLLGEADDRRYWYQYKLSSEAYKLLLNQIQRFLMRIRVLPPALWSQNYLFPLRLRHSKSFGSGNSFGTTCYHRFYVKKYGTFFMFFMKENRPNSHARSYSLLIWILFYYFR